MHRSKWRRLGASEHIPHRTMRAALDPQGVGIQIGS